MNEREIAAAALSEGNCLSLDDLQALADGRTAELAAKHVASCTRCQTESALLASFQNGPTQSEQQDVKWIETRLRKRWGARPWFRRPWGFAGLVLTCAASLVLAVGLLRQRSADAIPIRDSGEIDVLRSDAIQNPLPAGDLPQKPRELTWSPVPGALDYEVTLMQVDRTILWSTTVNQSSLTLPEAVRTRLLPYKLIRWRVTARDARGKPIASSAIQNFRFVP